MPLAIEGMKKSLHKMLIDSHVAAAAVALLLMFSGIDFVSALWMPFSRVGAFIATAIAILDIPYLSLDLFTRLYLYESALRLVEALLGFGAAWILSRHIYGVGPLRCLQTCGSKIRRPAHVRSVKENAR